MKNEEKKVTDEVKNIPRNRNQKITDEEVNQILKSASEQITEKKQETLSDKEKSDNKKVMEKSDKADKKPPVKKEKGENSKGIVEEEKKNSNRKSGDNQSRKNDKKVEEKIVQHSKREEKIGNQHRQQDKNKRGDNKKTKIEEKRYDKFEEETPLVIKNVPQMTDPYKDKITVGRIIGTFFECVWTLFKITVLVTIVTAVAGFFLSRELMIRGRCGNRQCTEGMTVAAGAASKKSNETEKAKEWLGTVKREKITIESDDKSILVARKIVINEENNKWVVILHGYNGSMEDIYDIAMHYASEDYNILMPDLRAHGESEGSFLGMGWLDRLDTINWIDVILEESPSAEIVIHGIDIGADTALMLSGEPIKSSIKAIVAEGAYTSAWEAVKSEYKVRHEKWPVFPLLNMMNPVMKIWAGYSLKEADAVKQVKKSRVPILLIRGGNDTYATERMTEQLNQAISSEHEVFVIEAGTHEDCRYAESDQYYNKTFEFIKKYVK